MAYYKNTHSIKYRAFDDSWKVVEMQDYRNYHIYRFVQGNYVEDGVLPDNVIIDLCVKWFSEITGTSCSFKDFEEEYFDRLKHYSSRQKEYFLECYSIITKEKAINENTKEKTIQNKNNFEHGLFCLFFIMSFFVFGGIAYVFKHLLLLVWYFVGFIIVAILNIIHSIFCILFDINGDMWIGDFPELSKIEVWQVGGWIYGFIVLAAICVEIYHAIKNRSI